jgi:hypothetical protein
MDQMQVSLLNILYLYWRRLCIKKRYDISMLVKPYWKYRKVIATGAAIRISNSCEFKDGMLYNHISLLTFAGFQELEYIRSYLFGKAWGEINGLLLVLVD